jgi:MFS family permease
MIIPVFSVTLGVFIAPIEREMGWTRTEITSGPLLIGVTGLLFSTLMGMIIDRVGFRIIGIAMLIAMILSTGLASLITHDLWLWWFCWGLYGFAATANPAVFNVPIVTVFDASRGLALMVRNSGGALTSALAPVMAVFLIDHYGWRLGYVGLALIWGGFALPIMFFFFKMPEDRSSEAKSGMGSTRPAARQPLPGVTMREGFKSPTFYKLMFASLCTSMVGTTLGMNMVPILTLEGISRTSAAAAAGGMGISTLFGKALGAFLIDRLDPKLLNAACSIGYMVMPAILLVFPGNLTAAAAGIAIYGFLQGFDDPAHTLLFTRHLGVRSFGSLTLTFKAVSSLAIGGAPMFASYLYDTTGSYNGVLWCAFPAFAASALFYLSLGRYPDQLPNQQPVLEPAN